MSGIQETNRYNMGFPQSEQNRLPNTIAAAATIAPVHILTFITGTTQIATITPPEPGYHQVILCFTNGSPGAFLTSGNIQRTGQPVQNVPVILHYDPSSAKYWVGAVSGVV